MKIVAMMYEIKNTNAAGARGSFIVSLNGDNYVSMMYAMIVFEIEIVILPRNAIRAPIPFTTIKLPECFKANTKADIALAQKPFPVRHTWM